MNHVLPFVSTMAVTTAALAMLALTIRLEEALKRLQASET